MRERGRELRGETERRGNEKMNLRGRERARTSPREREKR